MDEGICKDVELNSMVSYVILLLVPTLIVIEFRDYGNLTLRTILVRIQVFLLGHLLSKLYCLTEQVSFSLAHLIYSHLLIYSTLCDYSTIYHYSTQPKHHSP